MAEKKHFTHIYSEVITKLKEMRELKNRDDYERISHEYCLDIIRYQPAT